ncbi:DUF7687 domain-containing protein [Bifidobacterium pseudolongum]|uniref:DUF7687 domain-containing protein n=1 Tax=Bifidobacterium pseudolongum TaxID=1694 RepID=UPI0010221264|nr:hypothetical protein [Bifidobacterium pseudolongum]RYQ65460.1 Yga2E [Bifidobacterium pseudolongum subsp. globosum]
MKADLRFNEKTSEFWAYVRVITQLLRAAKRGEDGINSYEMKAVYEAVKASAYPVGALGTPDHPTDLATSLLEYFQYRAQVLNDVVRNDLMTAETAADEFKKLKDRLGAGEGSPLCDAKNRQTSIKFEVNGVTVNVPMNKQTGDKRNIQYFTGMIDLILADALGEQFDYDPRTLTALGDENELYYTMARRMDGAYPSTINPKAVWEIKEYYYTTTFGSKISDAVYITQLDGYELEEIGRQRAVPQLLLMVDAYEAWWKLGKPYLCRLIDVLNMGKVDEILFGREVLRSLPDIAKTWKDDELSLSDQGVETL